MRFLAIAISLALIAATAAALSIQGLSSVSIGEKPYDLSFKVKNDTATKQPLNVEFAIPTPYETTKPAYVNANSSAAVTARIYPEKGFEGTTYLGHATITLGGSTAEKNFSISYFNQDTCSVDREISVDKDGNVNLALQNNSYKEKNMTLISVGNAQAAFTVSGDTNYTLGPFEKRKFTAKIGRSEPFKGSADFTFSCAGSKVTETAGIDYAPPGGSGIAGMLNLAWLASIGSAVDSTVIIDFILAIAAAILLVAFIARLVKFYNDRK